MEVEVEVNVKCELLTEGECEFIYPFDFFNENYYNVSLETIKELPSLQPGS